MARHLIMDHTGHRTIEFNPQDRLALVAAERRFNKLLKEGYRGAVPTGDGTHRLIDKCEPGA